MKKRVVFFVMSLNTGGIETYLYRFIKYSNNVIEPIVICKYGDCKWKLSDDYKKAGAKVYGVKIGVIPSMKYYSLYKLLRQINPISVVDFTGDFSGGTMLLAKILKIPNRVVFYRESRYQFTPNFLKLAYVKFLHKLVRKFTTAILSNSEAALRYFFRLDTIKLSSNFTVVPNGIDVAEFTCELKDLRKELNLPAEAFVIGNVGRNAPAKNHESMIKAAYEMCDSNSDVYFVFCGIGVTDIKIKNPYKSRIKLLEYVTPIKKLYNTLNAFIFLSLNEGMPNVLIEAMLSKLPIVASNIESNREVLPKCYHNSLVDPYDICRVLVNLGEITKGDYAIDIENAYLFAKKHYSSDENFALFLTYLI